MRRSRMEGFPEASLLAKDEFEELIGQLHELGVRLARAVRLADSDRIDEPVLRKRGANIVRMRRTRDKFFGRDLFGEPAWDILLELYAAKGTGRKVSVSGACYATGVPLSTALRWIVRLEKCGWIRRFNDPLDKRRAWLTLSDEADIKMGEFLTRMGAATA